MLKINYKKFKLTPNTSIPLPLGVDKSQYNVRRHPQYESIISRSIDHFESNTKDIDLFCFYCGEKTRNFIPNFLHDNSGRNTWLVGDIRSGSVICSDCHISYGSSNIRYLDHVVDISMYHSNNLKRLLSFEPDVLIPSLEPAYLHFKYNSNGYLEPLSIRADRTIIAFNLNRKPLIERRLNSIQDFVYSSNSRINTHLLSPFDILFCQQEPIENNQSNTILYKNPSNQNALDLKNYISNDNLYEIPIKSEKIPYKSITFQDIYALAKESFFDNFPGISSFTFSGIRGFHGEQNIEFIGKGSIIILGENGVGKSTFLELFKRAVKQKSRRTLDDICSKDGNILPTYNISYNGTSEIQTYIERGFTRIKRFDCNLIHIGDSRISKSSIKKLIKWINSKRDNQDIIDWIANKLSALLELPENYYFRTEDGDVFWTELEHYYNSPRDNIHITNEVNKKIFIDELSSGYNSILYIFYKIVSSSSSQDESLKSFILRLSSSIVLIDEIELHLHPKFKKRIIRNIQDAFPEVMFIFTTHDPLVIKSINNGTRLVRFERHNGETVINKNLPDPRGLTTEQILTSPHFGLDTIDDNDLQPLIYRYNQEIKNKNWKVVSELRMSLFNMGYFGKTYRELIALSAVDAYFRDGKNPSTEEIVEELRKEDLHND